MYSGEDDNSLLLRLADTEIIATPLQIEREELPSSLIIVSSSCSLTAIRILISTAATIRNLFNFEITFHSLD